MLLATSIALSAAAAGRRVIFVDNSRTEQGDGSYARPFKRLADAARIGTFNGGEIMYVAEGNAPYDDAITLQRGQMLVGAAYGLAALRTEMKVELDAPIVAAVQGPGPKILRTVTMTGDNLVAGFTSAPDGLPGVVAVTPQGTLMIRNVWFRPTRDAFAIAIQEPIGAVTVTGGGIVAAARGSGVSIWGGTAPVTFEHFPMSGEFGSAVSIANRTGSVKFSGGSTIKPADAVHDVITVTNASGPVIFDDLLDIHTHGGRGLVLDGAKKFVITNTSSRIATTNAAAVDIRNSTVEISLESVSAEAQPPGRLGVGIAINGVHGRFAVTGTDKDGQGSGGTIRNAEGYGIAVEQTSNVRMANVNVIESGTFVGKVMCPEDLGVRADVVCRGGLFLRHLTASSFENILVDGGSKNGLVANNIGNVAFTKIDLRRSGALLQELAGAISFKNCSFADGGGVAVEQRFNRAGVAFEHCAMVAANQPMNSPFLLRARTTGFGALALELKNVEVHDNAGAGVEVAASDGSSLSLAISDSSFQHLGGTAVSLTARQSSRGALVMHRTRIVAPGVRDALVKVVLGDSAQACVDMSGNELTTGGSTPIRVGSDSAKARLIVVATDPAVGIAAPPGVLSSATSCP